MNVIESLLADAAAITALRREIHSYPELCFQEQRTSDLVAAKLTEWGLEELTFTTELVVSELVTNAIRYGADPIQVRVLFDRTLICEVFDSSNTSPHLRYAAMTDEGGRGLFLVAQLAERWGTRYTPEGKVIWAEQSLP